MRKLTSVCLVVVCLGLALPVAARDRNDRTAATAMERFYDLVASRFRHWVSPGGGLSPAKPASFGDGLIPPKP